MIKETKFIVETKKRAYKMPVVLNFENGRIEFLKSPFALKDEIKAMQGARWHGYIEGDNRKIWSVADSYRNRFQIEWLEGGNPYEWFDREVEEITFPKFGSPNFGYYDLMAHQKVMVQNALTYHYQIWGVDMGLGKTAAAFAVMKISQTNGWWWVGPKSSLNGIKHELAKWGVSEEAISRLMTYEGLVKTMREWIKGAPAPIGVVFDECQWIKNPSAQRTQCAQKLADAIRDEYGNDGFVLLMTGTPSPKSPADWWAPCEIAWPGFIKEGSRAAFEKRMGFFRLEETYGQKFDKRVAWKDNPDRCAECGMFEEEGNHPTASGEHIIDGSYERHEFKPSVNEVSDLYERLKGLVTIFHKKDCIDIPEKVYRVVRCEPSQSLLRVAKAITASAKNVITGLTQIRELSDGFQYRDVEDGYETCPVCSDGTVVEYFHIADPNATIHDQEGLDQDFIDNLESRTVTCPKCKGTQKVVKYKRITRNVPCPKDQAVIDLLEENYFQGRIVFFAGFTGSLDRLVKIAHKEGWDTIRVDGRGWRVERLVGKPKKNAEPEVEIIRLDNPLDYWIDSDNERVAFIAHPKSGGVSLTLCPQKNRPGATMACFYSNDYNPATRSQAEDRIHRIGMDDNKGAIIVDLFHLPTDEKVLNILRQNRKLELMSMGVFADDYKSVHSDENSDGGQSAP